jgi:hypothetical protein
MGCQDGLRPSWPRSARADSSSKLDNPKIASCDFCRTWHWPINYFIFKVSELRPNLCSNHDTESISLLPAKCEFRSRAWISALKRNVVCEDCLSILREEEKWMGCQDSNLGMTESKSVELPTFLHPTKSVKSHFYESRGIVAREKGLSSILQHRATNHAWSRAKGWERPRNVASQTSRRKRRRNHHRKLGVDFGTKFRSAKKRGPSQRPSLPKTKTKTKTRKNRNRRRNSSKLASGPTDQVCLYSSPVDF